MNLRTPIKRALIQIYCAGCIPLGVCQRLYTWLRLKDY